jgi:hypothetical protein
MLSYIFLAAVGNGVVDAFDVEGVGARRTPPPPLTTPTIIGRTYDDNDV